MRGDRIWQCPMYSCNSSGYSKYEYNRQCFLISATQSYQVTQTAAGKVLKILNQDYRFKQHLKAIKVGVKFSPFIICSGDIWRDAEAKNPPSGHPRDLF